MSDESWKCWGNRPIRYPGWMPDQLDNDRWGTGLVPIDFDAMQEAISFIRFVEHRKYLDWLVNCTYKLGAPGEPNDLQAILKGEYTFEFSYPKESRYTFHFDVSKFKELFYTGQD